MGYRRRRTGFISLRFCQRHFLSTDHELGREWRFAVAHDLALIALLPAKLDSSRWVDLRIGSVFSGLDLRDSVFTCGDRSDSWGGDSSMAKAELAIDLAMGLGVRSGDRV